jgi:hydrogenase/urease accessory protein HupE
VTPLLAHLVTTGLGPVYDGILHLLLSPDDLLGVIALALLVGLNGKHASRCALFALPSAWWLGGYCATLSSGELELPILSAATTAAVGAMAAFDLKLTPKAATVLSLLFGAFHGFLNGVYVTPRGLAGIAVTIFALTAIAAALAVSLRPPWTRIAIRVAASWIAAISLLLIGWTWRGA